MQSYEASKFFFEIVKLSFAAVQVRQSARNKKINREEFYEKMKDLYKTKSELFSNFRYKFLKFEKIHLSPVHLGYTQAHFEMMYGIIVHKLGFWTIL